MNKASPLAAITTPTHAAIAHHDQRVFGLSKKIWQRHHTTANNDGEEETSQLLDVVKRAVLTALKEGAGGYGCVGGHLHKVTNLHSLPSSSTTTKIVLRGDLIPYCHDDKSKKDLSSNDATTTFNNSNNDNNNDGNDENGVFQIQIVITTAKEGVYTLKLHRALYAKGKQFAEGSAGSNTTTTQTADATKECIGESTIESIIHDNEVLKSYYDIVASFIAEANDTSECDGVTTTNGGTAQRNEDNDKLPQGIHVDILLVEPHIINPRENNNDDGVIIIPPPLELNKMDSKYRPYSNTTSSSTTNNDNSNDVQSSLYTNVYTSSQFTKPSNEWERVNIKAFTLVALDVRKALVRIEFPEFEEGLKDKTFREVYQLNARLKSGSFATVCRGTHRATGNKIAVKCVLRDELPPHDDAAIYDEVLILSTLKHPLICPLIDFFEEKECYFLVMELMSGGDLFDRIGKNKKYNEKDARSLCKKMIESLRFCHVNSVAHRDMKPKNLLLVDDEDDCAIKLADFGFATRVYEPCSLTRQCGTPFFIAPEVLLREPYDERADMWSVGVITYLLLSGDLPFMGKTQRELFQNIVRGEFSFPEESWSTVSDEAKDLLRKLLVTLPSKRLTSSEAMRSKWMVGSGDRYKRNSLMHSIVKIQSFNARMKLKSAMFAVSAVTSLTSVASRRTLDGKRASLTQIIPLEEDGDEDLSSSDEEVES